MAQRDPALPGDWDGLVVLHAANPWDGVRLHDQHMAESLSRFVPVMYVDPPMSVLTPLRRPELGKALAEPRLRLLAPGLARLTPVVLPCMERPPMLPLTRALTRRAIGRAARALTGRVHAVVAASVFLRTLGTCGEAVRVYWAQDDYEGGAELLGVSPWRVRRAERRVAGMADLILASSPTVAERWRGSGRPTAFVPFGCDAERFAATDEAAVAEDARLPGPVAGFVGHLNERIDLALLEAVADTGVSLLLVGPRQGHAELGPMRPLLARPNVHWVGPKPFEALPSYLRAIDVGLVPYTHSAFNRGSFPLKTLEYLAAGRGVVATGLPAIRWLGTDLIEVADTPAAFADAVTRALARARTPGTVAARRAFAAEHSWPKRAELLAEAIGTSPAALAP